jgi:lactoylglutathione lyase
MTRRTAAQEEATMQFTIAHTNLNVFNLERSVAFYEKALGLQVQRRKEAGDGSFVLVFLGDDVSGHQIELTWLRDRQEAYNLGDNEGHIAFLVDEYEAAHSLHSEMGCICFENKGMGIYFIEDPDGYWLEIIPKHR